MSGNNQGEGVTALDGQKAGARQSEQNTASGNKQGGEPGGTVPLPIKQPPANSEATVANRQAQTQQPSPYDLRDLTAQEDMVFWAMWMFVVALATFVITSLGTLLIWRQVKLTRQAVEDTGSATRAMYRQTELMEVAQRPWMTYEVSLKSILVEKPHGDTIIGHDDDHPSFPQEIFRCEFDIILKNEGKTIARDISVEVRSVPQGNDRHIPDHPIFSKNLPDHAFNQYGYALAPGEAVKVESTLGIIVSTDELMAMKAKDGFRFLTVRFLVEINYRSLGDDRRLMCADFNWIFEDVLGERRSYICLDREMPPASQFVVERMFGYGRRI